jgi:hypothetical protein
MTEKPADLKSLYPGLTEAELMVARENLDRYLALAWEIFEESLMESRALDQAAFSEPQSRGRIEAKVDSQKT